MRMSLYTVKRPKPVLVKKSLMKYQSSNGKIWTIARSASKKPVSPKEADGDHSEPHAALHAPDPPAVAKRSLADGGLPDQPQKGGSCDEQR